MTGSRPQPTEAVQSGWLRGSVSATDRADFSVVAIGASAGGLGASEADHDGMPRNAIATGAVDYILSAAAIAAVPVERGRGEIIAPAPEQTSSQKSVQDLLPAIVDLLREKTAHDFTFYKHGTLERGVERRMAMAAINSPNAYLEFLRHDPEELDQLARDLLINVTGFFRDSPVFDFLAKDVIPDLVRDHAQDRPLRIWSAGCSSGEETYSLAMLLLEQIEESKREFKLQIFASDVDPEAVASAREGLYPLSIEAVVSPKRLAKFFSREDCSYRVSPDLRSVVVFAVHNVLADPPFARLDFVSCRNVLIYLKPEAQAKVLSLFHFALREGGLLLAGNSETAGTADGRFAVVSKPERLYRRVGGNRLGEFHMSQSVGDGSGMRLSGAFVPEPSRQTALSELCRMTVLEAYGPAAVLINRKLECLHFQGPTDRYLKVASGRPSRDLIAMAREGVRTKLRSAVRGALRTNARFVCPVERINGEAGPMSFSVVAEPVLNLREELLLVCFVEEPTGEAAVAGGDSIVEIPRVGELERELQETKLELQIAVHKLEAMSQEQMMINEEALSVNEEHQSTNQELLASKEKLQSLNEELNALNSQLLQTLARQRTTADDLQNVLYSSDVATIFLDTGFNIRFFTPATKALFNFIPSDVGRPFADLKSLTPDSDLLSDALAVLESQAPIEREVQNQSGAWFTRRILPYRARDKTEGVVITFQDITERRRGADALSVAKRQAEAANTAKSRFLAAASHDLRQPLQTLALVHGLLAKRVTGEKEHELIVRVDEALGSMRSMLDTLLDINQLEVGAAKAKIADFPVSETLERLRDELTYHAHAAGLGLRVMSCRLSIRSDPRLLEQMIRNLLSNALKYTQGGSVLVGCRRREGKLNIEIWDTGLGIPASELQAIFEEYHQVGATARQRSRGLGLGLSIVKSLSELLGHPIRVRSLPGKGSMFSIEVPLTSPGDTAALTRTLPAAAQVAAAERPPRSHVILIIEDDPQLRNHLELVLTEEGFRTMTAIDGPAALALLASKEKRPDLVLADYNLPNGLTGVVVSQKLRREFNLHIPFIILTGDISTEALRDIALHDCVQYNKPVMLQELTQAIDKLLAKPLAAPVARAARPAEGRPVSESKVFVVDDDDQVRGAMSVILEDNGHVVEAFSSCEAFLAAFHPVDKACLLIDAYLPGMTGLELLQKLRQDGHCLPAIMITGNSDVSVAVQAMKAGARDFIEKPIGREELIASIGHALELSQDSKKMLQWRESAVTNLARLTARQIEVMERVLAGHPSKNIAAELGISRRTVENHRASIMKRTRSKSLPDLARLALVAAGGDPQPPTAAPMGRGVQGVRLARQPSNTTDANSSVSNGCPASAVPNGAHSAGEGSLGRPSVRPA